MCVGREGSAADHIYLYLFFEERLDFLLGLRATVMGQKGRSHTLTISVEVFHHTFLVQVFMVVANSREVERELSVIYQWNVQQRRFLHHQTLETHSALDWEAFNIYNHSFLVVANHRRGVHKII